MKTVLLRIMVATVVVAGLLTVIVVTRLVLSGGAERPERTVYPFEVDDESAADRRARTVGGPDQGDYPQLHEHLERELLADGSVVYTWEGTRGELMPILLWASSDAPEAMPAILEAVEGLLAGGYAPERTVLLAFGSGETGIRTLASHLEGRGVRVEWALIPGAGLATGMAPGVGGTVGLVGTAAKGRVTLEVAGSLERALVRLDEEPFPARLEGPMAEQLDQLKPHMDPAFRMLAANLWIFRRPLLWVLSADPVSNAQIRTTHAAGFASAIEIRVAPWDSVDGAVRELRSRLADLDIEISVVDNAAPSRISSSSAEGFELIRGAVHGVFADVRAVVPFLSWSPLDASPLEPVAGEIYHFAPVRVDAETHEEVEAQSPRAYLDMVRFYAEVIRRGS